MPMGRNGNLRSAETQQGSFSLRLCEVAQCLTPSVTSEKISAPSLKLAVITVAEDVDLDRPLRGQGQCELLQWSARISNKLL